MFHANHAVTWWLTQIQKYTMVEMVHLLFNILRFWVKKCALNQYFYFKKFIVSSKKKKHTAFVGNALSIVGVNPR